MSTAKPGFTIVELLIVIVVIAIVAALAIVAYTGVQNRAHASKAASGAKSYEKYLRIARVDGTTLPSTSTCLGTVAQYPTGNGWNSGECSYMVDPTRSVLRSFDAPTMTVISPSVTIPPDVTWPTAQEGYGWGAIYYRGYQYIGNSDPALQHVLYFLNGDHRTTCPSGDAQLFGTTNIVTRCRIFLR